MKNTMIALTVVLASVSINVARADDSWDFSRESALKAFAELKARASQRSVEEAAAVGAAISVGAGVRYGAGKYAAYQAELAENAKAAQLLKGEIARVSRVVTNAVEPELKRFGAALLTKQTESGAAMTAEEIQKALITGLKDPAVRARIMSRLAPLGDAATATFDKIVGARSAKLLAKGMMTASQTARAINPEFALKGLGTALATSVGESVAPSTAKYTARAAARVAVRAGARVAGESLAVRCLGGALRFGLGALEAISSAPVTVAMILLDSSTAEAATMDGYYAKNLDALLELPTEEAARWMEYGSVRGALIKTRDLVSEMDGAQSLANHDGGEENLVCEAPQTQSSTAAVKSEAVSSTVASSTAGQPGATVREARQQ